MMTLDQDGYASTLLNLQMLSIGDSSSWDDEEPLMQNSTSSLSSSGSSTAGSSVSSTTSRSYSPPPSPRGQSRKRQHSTRYEYKNSHDALVGSISAVINFLSSAGVPKPSCDQLQKNLELGRYFAVLRRVQDYIQCITPTDEDETMAKIYLAVSAWEALCRYKAAEYKLAYKYCFSLRYEQQNQGGGVVSSSSSLPQEKIKAAIDTQVKIAEQCTACQKQLYLVMKWQRYTLRQMKRKFVMEPQGYKPIRCL